MRYCNYIQIVTFVLVLPVTSSADDQIDKKFKGPYCGVVAIYSASRIFDIKVDFKELIQDDYIGSNEGSSIFELKKAIEDNGMYALPVEKYTTDLLRKSPYPIILHVRGAYQQQYNHYVLYLGQKNGKALLFDYLGLKRLPFYKLKSIWNGNGVIISDGIIQKSIFEHSAFMTVLYRVSTILFVVILLKILFTQTKVIDYFNILHPYKSTAVQSILIISFSIFIAISSNFINDESLLAHEDVTAAIQQAHQGNFIPKISERKVRRLLGNHTVFIDARLARDYEAGHLEGAISVPVDANDVNRRQIVADIDKDARVVLYCQSAGCKYAEIVALKLKDDGFSNISIYKNGWAEWKAKNGKEKGEQS